MDNVIEKFLESEQFRCLTTDPDVIMVYVGGSRSTGMNDINSDYDMVVVVTPRFKLGSFGMPPHMQKELHMHFYTDCPVSYLCSTCVTWGRCIFWMHMSVLSDDNILYKNPSYSDTIDTLFNMREELFKYGASSLILMYENEIRRAITKGLSHHALARKVLYHIMYASISLLNGGHPSHSLSREDREFIFRIKKRYREGISCEDYGTVKNVLMGIMERKEELHTLSSNIHNTLYTILVKPN